MRPRRARPPPAAAPTVPGLPLLAAHGWQAASKGLGNPKSAEDLVATITQLQIELDSRVALPPRTRSPPQAAPACRWGDAGQWARRWLAGGWLAPGALCVVEETASVPFQPGPGFSVVDERNYGETVIRFIETA